MKHKDENSKRRQVFAARAYHRAVLLDMIRARGAISRTTLRERTGLRLASITELTRELLELELIREDCELKPVRGVGRGRRQTLLRFNPAGRLVAGLEFNSESVLAVVVDLAGCLVGKHSVKLTGPRTPARVMPVICNVLDELLRGRDDFPDKFIGLGVADPGLVDSRKGVSIFASMLTNWHDVPIAKILTRHFDHCRLPVYVDANIRAKTLYEQRFGVARGARNVMFIEIADGIGCALMNNGDLYYGAGGVAGELGHMQVAPDGPLCRCGARGCLEAVASFPALVRQARAQTSASGRDGARPSSGQARQARALGAMHILAAAERGDKLAMKIVNDMLGYLGMAIVNAVNLYNPEMIVFDSRMHRWRKLIIEPLNRIVMRRALAASVSKLKVEISELGEEAGALGAATLVLDRFFAIPQITTPEVCPRIYAN